MMSRKDPARYECPVDCEQLGMGNYQCQDRFMVDMDSISVYTDRAVCEEPGYGCS